MITKDCLILRFKDYWSDELFAAACHDYDLDRGYIDLKLYDNGHKRYYSIGKRSLKECVRMSRFTTLNSASTSIMKWEDRDKLFEKYPELKQLCA